MSDPLHALIVGLGFGTLTLHDRVHLFEAMAREQPQVPCPLFHYFANGVYARELHIPAGVIATGKIHKHPCINILAKGELSTIVGGEIVRIAAPFVNVTPAGSKRIAYIHSDIVWITVHATGETDVAKLEHDLACDTEREYQDFLHAVEAEKRRCLS